MNKEFFSNSGTKHGLLAVTALGAAEGAAIGVPLLNPVLGGIVGGATAYTLEKSRRAMIAPSPATESISQPFAGDQTPVDITVESTSTTKRTDVPEGESEPIVKSAMEQANGVAMHDLPSAVTALRERTRANAFPTWETSINEKTVASATNTSLYTHTPHQVS